MRREINIFFGKEYVMSGRNSLPHFILIIDGTSLYTLTHCLTPESFVVKLLTDIKF